MSSIPASQKDMFTIENQYGYKINISHPAILPIYEKYKRSRGLPLQFPISDKERLVFEGQIFKVWEKRAKRKIEQEVKRYEKTA